MELLKPTGEHRDTRHVVRNGLTLDEASMTVLMVHNSYRETGGEDHVFADEASLLESRGHHVIRYRLHNDVAVRMNPVNLAGKTIYNSSSYREITTLIREHRPRVAHFHNTFPLISPAGYYAAAAEGVPVVQTLHNYRLLCPNGLFFRDGRPCEDCLGAKIPLDGVVHACYRESRAASGVVAAMLATHRSLGTWARKVDAYVTPTEFARRKFVEGGLPADKIVTKPNFVNRDPGPGDGGGGYALFVGRLSPEKGLVTLLDAWRRLGERAVPLKVVGDGPLAHLVRRASSENPRIEFVGSRPPAEVHALMRCAAVLVFPSELYETFGRVIVESFAAGTPVVATDIGSAAELVDHGRTGFLFSPGSASDLSRHVARLGSPAYDLHVMRENARAQFEERYTAERNYEMLTDIYESLAGPTRVRA
jgi:glycosyltransferase involved in cell wall biosynthesis